MLYMVELNFSAPASLHEEWHAWYEGYLKTLVSLEGLNTAQRFQATAPGAPHWQYLALYSLASLDLYDTQEYRDIGGGGNASSHYREYISRRRNVYAGIDHMPEVTAEGRILLCEDAPDGVDLPDILFRPLKVATGRRQAGASEFNGAPVRRAIAVSDVATVARLDPAQLEGVAVYAPITRRHVTA